MPALSSRIRLLRCSLQHRHAATCRALQPHHMATWPAFQYNPCSPHHHHRQHCRPCRLQPHLATLTATLAGVGPGALVLDPCCGSGALLEAAWQLGAAAAVGCDLELPDGQVGLPLTPLSRLPCLPQLTLQAMCATGPVSMPRGALLCWRCNIP
jgi:hypothetical protein